MEYFEGKTKAFKEMETKIDKQMIWVDENISGDLKKGASHILQSLLSWTQAQEMKAKLGLEEK